jgi:hypothetical protein
MPTKEEKKRRKLIIILQQKYPTYCFCEDHLYSKEEIKETKSYWDYGLPCMVTYNLYKCFRCGKYYNDIPALA